LWKNAIDLIGERIPFDFKADSRKPQERTENDSHTYQCGECEQYRIGENHLNH
jgi:hypothetical protein